MDLLTLVLLAANIVLTHQTTTTFPIDLFSSWVGSSPQCRSTNNVLSLCGKECQLSSTFYPINRIKEIHLTINVLVRTCDSLTTPCSEKFNFYTLHKETVINTYNVPENVTSASSIQGFKNFSIPISINAIQTYPNGIAFRFGTEKNFCGTFNAISAFYNRCPAEAPQQLLKFDLEPAPERFQVLNLTGMCIDNAAVIPGDQDPYITCKHDGTFDVFGQCYCSAGYERSGNSCKACSKGYFKSGIGRNTKCLKCGDNSEQSSSRTQCNCINSSFRLISEIGTSTAHCYAPPSAPSSFDHSSFPTITWNIAAPGSNSDGHYQISCVNCSTLARFNDIYVNETLAKLEKLKPYYVYRISIVKLNNITELTKKSFAKVFLFTTPPGPPEGEVQEVRKIIEDDGSIKFSWIAPVIPGGPRVIYDIQYGSTEIKTEKTSFKISPSTNTETYNVKITPVSIGHSGEEYVSQSPPYQTKVTIKGKGISLNVALGGAAAAFIAVLVIVIVACFVWRHRHPKHLQIYRMEDGTVQLQRNRFFSTGRLYVDPTTYSAVEDAVYEFTTELNHKDLTIGKIIGNGEFADVYKGTLTRNGAEVNTAVKMLKASPSNKDRDDFVSEAAILGQFSDPNVITLHGVILKDYPNVILLEYMSNGSLDKYLQQNDNQFSVMTLLGMTRGVASGMKYLSELGFIHRDLAARNILVDKQDVCKIADFGMSRELKTDETYDTRGGKIPIKWTAPEAIEFKKFTTASDVWSYGILLWEIMSYGIRPYWNWSNYEVLERLATGYRLPPPMECPKVVHDLMLLCWHKDRTKRPKFVNIRESIEEWIRYPDLLRDIASVITKSDENLDYSIMETITNWLEAIKMEQYAPLFIEQGFGKPKEVLHLTSEDLEQLGVVPIGHRKKIMKAIKYTRQQVDGKAKVKRSTSSAGTKLSRSESSAGFGAALSKKISFGKGALSAPSDKSVLTNKNTLTKKSSLSCV